MRPVPLKPWLLALLLALPAHALASTFILDPLSEALPPNPCLPVSARPIVFVGSMCDGATCPPGIVVSGCPSSSSTGQYGLPSIYQNASQSVWRETIIQQNSASGFTGTAELRTDLARMLVSGADPVGTLSYLRYGTAGWNLHFPNLGVVGLKVLVDGDITPARPLHCTVQLIDRDVAFRYGSKTVIATAPGLVTFPLGTFFVNNGFDFTGIDDINFSFTDCAFGFCDQPVSPRSYAVGPPSLDVIGGTPVSNRSWGRLKVLYR